MHVAGGKRPRGEEDEQIVGDVLRNPGFRDLTPELVGEIMALLPRLGRVRLALASRRTLAAYRGMPHANERKIPARDMLVEPPVPLQRGDSAYHVARMDITPDDTLLLFPSKPTLGVAEVTLDGTLIRVHEHPRPSAAAHLCAYAYDADSDRMAVALSSVWTNNVLMQVYERRTQKLVRSFPLIPLSREVTAVCFTRGGKSVIAFDRKMEKMFHADTRGGISYAVKKK